MARADSPMKCSVEILETNKDAPMKKPSDIAASKKIIFGSAFLPREVHADAKHDGE